MAANKSEKQLTKPKEIYASFHRRLLASAIDSIVFTIVLAPFLWVAGQVFIDPAQLQELETQLAQPGPFSASEAILNNKSIEASFYLNIAQLVVLTIATFLFWKRYGATPGKMLTHCVIVDEKTLKAPSRRQLAIRMLGYFLSTLPLCAGFLAINFTKKRQGFHDILAKTVVIEKK
jgi:uncharacterized RDD family membrane protein YckC